MRKHLFLLCIINMLVQNLQAQQDEGQLSYVLQNISNPATANFQQSGRYQVYNPGNKVIEGSPYWNEAWQEAVMEDRSGKKMNVMARYRAYDDEMEIKRNEQYFLLDKLKVKSLSFGKTVYSSLTILGEDNKMKRHFFLQVSEGKISLLKKQSLKLLPPNYNPATMMGRKNDALVQKEHWFYTLEDDLAQEIPSRKDKFLAIFKDKKKLVGAFMTKNNLRHKNEADLLKIAEYYNSL